MGRQGNRSMNGWQLKVQGDGHDTRVRLVHDSGLCRGWSRDQACRLCRHLGLSNGEHPCPKQQAWRLLLMAHAIDRSPSEFRMDPRHAPQVLLDHGLTKPGLPGCRNCRATCASTTCNSCSACDRNQASAQTCSRASSAPISRRRDSSGSDCFGTDAMYSRYSFGNPCRRAPASTKAWYQSKGRSPGSICVWLAK